VEHTCPICSNTKEILELRPVKVHTDGASSEPVGKFESTEVLFWCPCGTIWSPERQVEDCLCHAAVWPGNM